MSFKRFLYLVGELPRIFGLIRELWKILVTSDDEKLKEFLGDIENVHKLLSESQTREDRMAVAVRISALVKQLRK